MDKPVGGALQAKPGLDEIGYYMVGISSLPGFDKIIKLSSNESPLGPSPRAVEAAAATLANSHRYPELNLEELPEAIAKRFGLDPSMIAFGPGSDELLLRLVNIYSGVGDEVIYSKHAYMQFPIYAKRAGSTPIAADDDDFAHSVDKMLACVTERTRVVIIANPDNPSGTYLSGAEVRRLRDGLPSNVLLIVDSAYDEFARADDYETATRLVGEYDNVVVTRTYSKVFCLAGLRLGWCYGPRPIIDLMERVGPSFAVSTAAQAAGIEAVRDDEHMQKVLEHNVRWIDRFSGALRQMGLEVYPSQTNFMLVRFPQTPGRTASEADAFLKGRGIVARKFAVADFADMLRFTVGLDDEMELTLAALGEFMGTG
jgi:histidinol-phosphate aminotransferase